MRGCLKYVALFLVVIVLTVAVVVGVLAFSERGLIPWLTVSYSNRAVLVLDSVQRMSVLTGARYNFSTLVTSERELPPEMASLYGERLMLVAVGAVTAGIDLGRLTAADVMLDGGTLTVRLPPPEIQDCFLDENASYVADRTTGIFARSAVNLEAQARRFAVQQFRGEALERGILEAVQVQAEIALGQFLRLSLLDAAQTVKFIPTDPPADAPLPPTCQ
jgi:hypothetical protein